MNDEFNTTMQDAVGDLDKNHGTESDEFDAALQDTLDGLDKNQLTKNNEFELEHEEWNRAMNSMMRKMYRAGGSVSSNHSSIVGIVSGQTKSQAHEHP